MARTGSVGGNGSGDIFLAFSTASTGIAGEATANVRYLLNDYIDPLLFASAYASEEAIINSMVAAESMTGHRGMSVESLPHDRLIEVLKEYNRLS
jgi:L-aminopeptidase/D-esterase-like protein